MSNKYAYLDQDIEQDEYELDEPGENPVIHDLGIYRFRQRAVKKLSNRRLEVGDVMTVLVQEKFGWSRTTGSQISVAECDKGAVLVVFKSILDRQPDEQARFEVVTAYRV